MAQIKAHHLRELQAAEQKGEITYSRMVEVLNEIAQEGAEFNHMIMKRFKDRYAVAQDTEALLNLHLDAVLEIEAIGKSYPVGHPERQDGVAAAQYLQFIQNLCERRLLAEAGPDTKAKTLLHGGQDLETVTIVPPDPK